MILPKELLDQISYYEFTSEQPILWLNKCRSRFTLHFKQWWKPRKTIFMEWSLTDDDTHREPQESVELRKQLYEYIKSRT